MTHRTANDFKDINKTTLNSSRKKREYIKLGDSAGASSPFHHPAAHHRAKSEISCDTQNTNLDPVGFEGQFGYRSDWQLRQSGGSGGNPYVVIQSTLNSVRYYDPSTGHLASRDPIGMAGGINLYGYCGGDPVNGVDPSGNGEEPIDEGIDFVLTCLDICKVSDDYYKRTSSAEKSLDWTALGLDGIGLIPIVPPGMGKGYKLVHAGVGAIHTVTTTAREVNVARRQTQAVAKAAQVIMMAAGNGPSGGSPALKGDPYHPDSVQDRINQERLPYEPNVAHNSRSSSFNPRKTPEPADAEEAYSNAQLGERHGVWFARGKKGWYRYFSDNAGGAHFSGIVNAEDVPATIRKME